MLAGPGLLAAALAFAGPAAASRAAHAAPKAPHDVRFIQTATRSNVVENSTYINNPATNGHRHVLIFVTPTFNPNNTVGGRFNNHPIGVWYDTSVNKWAIFNEDSGNMQLNRSFNVLVVPRATRTAFQVTSSSLNTSGDSLFLNHALINNHTRVLLQVTQLWNRTGSTGVYNQHNIGVRFSGPQWAIFNEDGGNMSIGASFNVLVGISGTGANIGTVLKARSGNFSGDSVFLNNRNTNNNSKAMVFETPNWNPGDVGGTNDDAPIGVWYDKGLTPHQWAVFNQDKSNMPLHAAFNLLIFRTR
jgi:hypothetical protein